MWKTMEMTLNKGHRFSAEELKKISPFIFLRWLGSNPVTLPAANVLNQYPDIPVENQVRLVQHTFGGRIGKIYYIKGSDEGEPEDIKRISEYYSVNTTKASEIAEFLSSEEMSRIRLHFLKRQESEPVTAGRLRGKK